MAKKQRPAIPFDYVEAELAAFPIGSEASFRSASVVLDPVSSEQKMLWAASEQKIVSSVSSLPLDQFALIRDGVWFGKTPDASKQESKIRLVDYLHGLATRYLDPQGRPIEVPSQVTENSRPTPSARLRWSWFCRALPADLIRTAREIGNADEPAFHLTPAVERLLEAGGFSETHLHLGAAADFSLIWTNLMHALAIGEVCEKEFASPGACFDHGRTLAKWVMWAAIVRLILAEWLFDSSRELNRTKVLDFTSTSWHRRMDVGMINDLYRLTSELAQGCEGDRPVRFARGRSLYRSLIRPFPFLAYHREEKQRLRARLTPDTRMEVLQNDPMARVVGWHERKGTSPETIFVGESLRYLKEQGERGDFACLFWQTTRIRCMLYRHLVQRSLTPGLQQFVRSFSRIKPVRQSLPDRVSIQTAVRHSGSHKGLRSLEVRLGTKDNVSECLKRIRDVEGVRTKPATIEVGAVFHFSRDRGGGWKKGIPNAYGMDHSYPGIPQDRRLQSRQDVGNPSGFRFARFYLKQRCHAQALVTLLRGFPAAVRTIRGFDLCTDEAGVPIWVMAPLIRWVREAGRVAATSLRDHGIAAIPPPRTTVHTGEDFVHLLTGLRRLDDSIRYLGLEENDRIGHGVALGIDPMTWFDRAGRIVQTREERLFDLVWEWDCYADRGVEVESARLAYIEHNIARISGAIFGEYFDESLKPEDLSRFSEMLHDERELRYAGFPDRSRYLTPKEPSPKTTQHKSWRMMREYLCNTQVWWNGRGQETIVFDDLENERVALVRLQGALRHRVGRLGLTVEVNPSSNLMIGDLGLLEDHPIWRLMPYQPMDDIPPLSVCIGSDDPLTFATTLPHEYQLLFDSIVLSGQSHEVALDWLDKAREVGMRARFTLPRAKNRCAKGLASCLLPVPAVVLPP